MGRPRAALILSCFLLLTLVSMPLQAILLLLHRRAAGHFGRLYWEAARRLTNTRLRVIGEPVSGPVILAANHSSWLDVVVLGSQRPLCFLAKREIKRWPLVGLIARLGRTIFIDRQNRSSVRRTLSDMSARLAAGDALALFPEGTSSDGNRVLPFRAALFEIAEGRAVPVQPVSLAYTGIWGLPLDRRWRPLCAWYGDMPLLPHLWRALRLGPFDVNVVFHPPLPPTMAGRKALT